MKRGVKKKRSSHIWKRKKNDWYVEPHWVFQRLFDVEKFKGAIDDPFCGSGRVVLAARRHGHTARGQDIINRGFRGCRLYDFWYNPRRARRYRNLASNPPFKKFKRTALRALALTDRKVALVAPARIIAAATWLEETPLKAIYYLNPRPSMPPGNMKAKKRRRKKKGSGTQDFVILVWDHAYRGEPVPLWLRRDRK